MIHTLFDKLDDISPLDSHAHLGFDPPKPASDEATGLSDTDLKRLRRMTLPDPKSSQVPSAGLAAGEQVAEPTAELGAELSPNPLSEEPQFPLSGAEAQVPPPVAVFMPTLVPSYGLPALSEILRVIVALLNPRAGDTTDSMRFLGMNVMMALVEAHGTSLLSKSEALRTRMQDTACNYLFQLAQSENPNLVSYALRTIQMLFDTAGAHLKFQLEFFIKEIFIKLAPTFPLALEPWKENAGTDPLLSLPRSSPGTPAPGTSPPPPPPPPPPQPKTSGMAPLTGEMRELYVEALCSLIASLSRAGGDAYVTLWANFDVELDADNVVEGLVRFWSRAVFAQPPNTSQSQAGSGQGQDGLQMVALDAIIGLVQALYARQQEPAAASDADAWPDALPSPGQLTEKKERKATLLEGAEKFNRKPKEGIAFFRSHRMLPPAPSTEDMDESVKKADEAAVARFLRSCPRLDKKGLGEFLAGPANIGILEQFIGLFDFGGRNVADGLRTLLEAFRLPGEAQQISRITEVFASHYFSFAPKGIASSDAVYVLAFSVIMLNTDQHNPQAAKRRMQLDDYRKNLRGVNDGQDFDQDLLAELYESIRNKEIIMPEEHAGAAGFDFAWKELLSRMNTSAVPVLVPCTTNAFDRTLFQRSWRPLVAALAHGFSTFRDEQLLERAIAGFRQCAALASQFGMVELFDFMAQTLADATGLIDDHLSVGVNNARVERQGPPPSTPASASGREFDAAGEHADASVSALDAAEAEFAADAGGNEPDVLVVGPLSVRFGLNFKGQMAAVVLFNIANGNGHSIQTSWPAILRIAKNLFAHSLVPPDLSSMFLFGKPPEDIPLRPKRLAHAPAPDARGQGGLFSTLSSYFLAGGAGGATPLGGYETNYPPPPDVTAEDVEATLCTLDCLASCRIENIFAQMTELDGDRLVQAVASARELADWFTLDRLAAAKHAIVPDSGSSTPRLSASAPAPAAGDASAAGVVSGPDSPQAAGTPRTTPRPGPSVQLIRGQLPYDPSAMFLQERLTELVVSARAPSEPAWRLAMGHFVAILSDAGRFHPLLVERAVVSTLRLLAVAPTRTPASTLQFEQQQQQPSQGPVIVMPAPGAVRDEALVALDALRAIPAELVPAMAEQLILGVGALLAARGAELLVHATEWNVVLTLVGQCAFARNAAAASEALVVVRDLALGTDTRASLLSGANYGGVLRLLREFALASDVVAVTRAQAHAAAQAGGKHAHKQPARRTLTEKKEQAEYDAAAQQRGLAALAVLSDMRHEAPRLVEQLGRAAAEEAAASASGGSDAAEEQRRAWGRVWIGLLDALAQQVVNGYRAARHEAIGRLQKVLLAPELLGSLPAGTDAGLAVASVLHAVVFPALDTALSPGAAGIDAAAGLGETWERLGTVLGKTLLAYLPALAAGEGEGEGAGLLRVWAPTLDLFRRMLVAARRTRDADAAARGEAVAETVKNVVLVVHAAGLLVAPPSSAEAGAEAEAEAAAAAAGGGADTRSRLQQAVWAGAAPRLAAGLPGLLESVCGLGGAHASVP